MIKSTLRAAMQRLGIYAGKIAGRPYGEDMLLDIERLSAAYAAPVKTILDVGANIGQSAIRFQKYWPGAEIYSFEPHPTTFQSLQAVADRLAKVRAFNLALGDTEGTVDFYEYDSPLVNSRVPNSAFANRTGITPRKMAVEQSTVDLFCKAHGVANIDFLKIDTEGFDVSVLSGAQGMLSAGLVRFIECEFAISTEGNVTKLADLVRALEPHGYVLFSTYLDYVMSKGHLFANGNALFIRPN